MHTNTHTHTHTRMHTGTHAGSHMSAHITPNTPKDKVEITVLEQEEKRSFFSILAPRVVKVKMVLKEGDRVVYSKYAGTEIKFEGETYIVIKQNDILAKVEN